MTVQALKEFMRLQGASKSINLMEWDKIWTINKKVIDPIAPRYNAVSLTNRVIVNITNYPYQAFEIVSVPLHPKNPKGAHKALVRSNTIIIEQDDAKLLTKDMEVTMMSWGNVIVRSILKDSTGAVASITAELNLKGDPSSTQYKLHWVACEATSASSIPRTMPEVKVAATSADDKLPVRLPLHSVPTVPWSNEDVVPLTLVEFDQLITVPKLDEDKKFEDFVTPQTQFETPAIGEGSLRNLAKGDIIQLQRRGFFICDRPWGGPSQPAVLFLIPDGKQKAMSTLSSKVVKKKATMAELASA
jgi:glutamyl-tRNA synthetase